MYDNMQKYQYLKVKLMIFNANVLMPLYGKLFNAIVWQIIGPRINIIFNL
jgi:hypothetical protein